MSDPPRGGSDKTVATTRNKTKRGGQTSELKLTSFKRYNTKTKESAAPQPGRPDNRRRQANGGRQARAVVDTVSVTTSGGGGRSRTSVGKGTGRAQGGHGHRVRERHRRGAVTDICP